MSATFLYSSIFANKMMHNERPAKLDYWFGNGLTSLYFNIHARLMMEGMIMHVTGPLSRDCSALCVYVDVEGGKSNYISQARRSRAAHKHRRTRQCILFTTPASHSTGGVLRR